MRCYLCGRLGPADQLRRGWKICGQLVLCRKCRREQYRLRTLTMMVAESTGDREFSAIEQAWSQATPLFLPDQAWKPTFVEGQPLVRVYISNRWWGLRVHSARWSHGQRAAYQQLSTGEGISGELRIYRRPTSDGIVPDRPNSDRPPRSGLVCKTTAWLPRTPQQELVRREAALWLGVRPPDTTVRNQDIREMDISNLRRAIRANWVSFPSQIPTLPHCGQPGLEHKIVLLYLVMGWNCTRIAARYGLVHQEVRCVLNAWKLRAANAGYIQHIPPAEVMSQLAILGSPVHVETGTLREPSRSAAPHD